MRALGSMLLCVGLLLGGCMSAEQRTGESATGLPGTSLASARKDTHALAMRAVRDYLRDERGCQEWEVLDTKRAGVSTAETWTVNQCGETVDLLLDIATGSDGVSSVTVKG